MNDGPLGNGTQDDRAAERKRFQRLAEFERDGERGKRAYCIHPEAGEGLCKGGIVRAHTVQRSALTRIARDGHVYEFHLSALGLHRNGGVFPVRSVGLNKATTFTGFCGGHDDRTFRPVEKRPFVGSREQLFLLAYRAFCRELYLKRWGLEFFWSGDEFPDGDDPWLNVGSFSERAGLWDIEHTKASLDRYLLSSDFDAVSSYVVEFDRTPDVLCSGACLLEADFAGHRLQVDKLFDPDARPGGISLSVIPTDRGGVAAFTWVGDDKTGQQFFDSLDALCPDELPHAVLRSAFEFLENTTFAPDWWDGLSSGQQGAVEDRKMEAVNLLVERRADCLLDDGVRLVEWAVTARGRV